MNKTTWSSRVVMMLTVLAFCVTAGADTYYVDAINGDDANDGSAATPWKSITHALANIDTWSTSFPEIQIAPGVYDVANGEVFPLETFDGMGVESVSLLGPPTRDAVVRGWIRTGSFEGFSGATIERLHLKAANPGTGVGIADNSSTYIADNIIEGYAIGVDVFLFPSPMVCQFGCLTDTHIASNEFIGNDTGLSLSVLAGMAPQGSTSVDASKFENNKFDSNRVSISLSGSATSGFSTIKMLTEIRNNTFINSDSYAIELLHGGDASSENLPTIVNNIFAFGDGYGIYDAVPIYTDPTRIDYNLFYQNRLGDMVRGTNAGPNLFVDPLLADVPGGDFHLQAFSPCIDAGEDAGSPRRDLDGLPRPVDGDGDTIARTDIGAHEHPVRTSRLNLRRADFADAAWPDKWAVFPFDENNPRTPAIATEVVSGDSDPTPGILSSIDIPLAFYQIEPTSGGRMCLVKDRANDTVKVEIR